MGFFLAVSIVFHFLVSTSALYFAEVWGGSAQKNDVTQIEILEKDDLQERLTETRQLIKQLKTSVKEIQDSRLRARFESERAQRVEKETQARNLGLTQNSSPTFSANTADNKPDMSRERSQPQAAETTDGELPEFARAQPRNQPSLPVAAGSAISSLLPSDISQSNATNLNTDANIYYSFYNRVQDLFYVRWVERVNQHWSRTSYDYKRAVLAGKNWSTQIEVWLKANGEYHSAYILKKSGHQPFDEAAVFAFKDARFFPNPPRAKVEPDGYVRLRYRFNVMVSADR